MDAGRLARAGLTLLSGLALCFQVVLLIYRNLLKDAMHQDWSLRMHLLRYPGEMAQFIMFHRMAQSNLNASYYQGELSTLEEEIVRSLTDAPLSQMIKEPLKHCAVTMASTSSKIASPKATNHSEVVSCQSE